MIGGYATSENAKWEGDEEERAASITYAVCRRFVVRLASDYFFTLTLLLFFLGLQQVSTP